LVNPETFRGGFGQKHGFSKPSVMVNLMQGSSKN